MQVVGHIIQPHKIHHWLHSTSVECEQLEYSAVIFYFVFTQ